MHRITLNNINKIIIVFMMCLIFAFGKAFTLIQVNSVYICELILVLSFVIYLVTLVETKHAEYKLNYDKSDKIINFLIYLYVFYGFIKLVFSLYADYDAFYSIKKFVLYLYILLIIILPKVILSKPDMSLLTKYVSYAAFIHLLFTAATLILRGRENVFGTPAVATYSYISFILIYLLVSIDKKKIIDYAVLFTGLILILISGVRSVMIAIFIVLLLYYKDYIMVRANRYFKYLVPVLFILAMILLFNIKDFHDEVVSSFSENTSQYKNIIWRLDNWSIMTGMMLEKPLFGYDLGYKYTYFNPFVSFEKEVDPHNSYMQVFFRNGIIGTLIFILIHIFIIKKFVNMKIKTEYYYFYLYFFIVCVLVVSFNVGLENPYIGLVYWYTLAILRCLTLIEE